jgi:hypothetical protein
MSRPATSPPLEVDPVTCFARRERAVREPDFVIATEAKRHLSRLGWDVRHAPIREDRKPPQTAAGRDGVQ